MNLLNDSQPPRIWVCTYRDGTTKDGLSYLEAVTLFLEAFDTRNPCVVTTPNQPYNAP